MKVLECEHSGISRTWNEHVKPISQKWKYYKNLAYWKSYGTVANGGIQEVAKVWRITEFFIVQVG